MIAWLRRWARKLMEKAVLVWFAARDRRVFWGVRLLAALTALYAFSPVDLIPDFIPVLGVLDDLILLPLGVWLVLRLLPARIKIELEARAKAETLKLGGRTGLLAVLCAWGIFALIIGWIVIA